MVMSDGSNYQSKSLVVFIPHPFPKALVLTGQHWAFPKSTNIYISLLCIFLFIHLSMYIYIYTYINICQSWYTSHCQRCLVPELLEVAHLNFFGFVRFSVFKTMAFPHIPWPQRTSLQHTNYRNLSFQNGMISSLKVELSGGWVWYNFLLWSVSLSKNFFGLQKTCCKYKKN